MAKKNISGRGSLWFPDSTIVWVGDMTKRMHRGILRHQSSDMGSKAEYCTGAEQGLLRGELNKLTKMSDVDVLMSTKTSEIEGSTLTKIPEVKSL